MIETIGAEFVHSIEEAHTATHVIASDGITKLRRTPKLMICICRVAQILSIEWLEQSSKLQCVLDTDDFLLLNDREAEKRYDFSMKTTLRNGILARKRRGGVLGGWSVYICSGVAGNRAPSLKEIHLIIEAGGGQVLKCLVNTDAFDPPKTIVLTSDPSTKSQFGERGVAKAVRFGAKVMSTSLLFHTIITQNLFDIDIDGDTFDDNIHINPATSQAADTVVCTSPVSIASSVSARSHTPVERENARKCSHLPTSTPVCATAVKCNDSGSVHTRGSRVVHLERAVPSPEPKKRKLNSNVNTQATSQMCSISITRQSHHGVLTSIKALSAGNSQAAYLTSILWQEYFNDARKASFPAPIAKNFSNRPRKGVRCLRGRNRSISPLVSCTNPGNRNEPTIAKSSGSFCNHLLMENLFVTWESFILFTLEDRAKTLVHTMTYTSDKISPASHFFPHPTAIVGNDYEKSGVDSTHPNLPHKGLSLSVDAMEGASYEIFGTLQDLFSLHRQHQTSGMIPEQVVAMLSLKAIEAVAAMHSCGIVHNDIGLDSFLVVKRVETFAHNWGQPELEKSIDSWYLQLIGFGNKAAVLNCRDDCRAQHFAHDYQCLANVIHLLITGGVELTLTSTAGTLDFSSKPYIKGNLFLRGALSWCSLFQALLCVGELSSETSHHFRLHYPVDFSNISTSNDERMAQFGWSCRVLQELCDRRVLNDFIDRLCTHNSRFTHPTTDLSKYGSGTSIGRQSFTCYTSSDQTADHLIEIESNLQSGFTALSNRETAFNKAVAKFEQSKIDQQSILRREGDVHMREHDLLRREREHALEMKQLDALKEEIRRTEMRIEQKLQLLKATSSASSTRSIQHNAELENPPRNDNAQDLHEYENNETTPYTTLNSERSFESRSHASHKSATASILEQPLRKVSGHLHKNRIRFTKADAFISPHGSQRKSTTALKERLPTADPSKNAERASQEDFDREIQYSQESTSSSKQKKKGSGRKSPKCSLHFLPRSPQKTPQKVFIDLGED
jgi:serine/threonine protein kinase